MGKAINRNVAKTCENLIIIIIIIRCITECALIIAFGASINKAKWASKFAEVVEFRSETVDADFQGTFFGNFSQRGHNLFGCFGCDLIAGQIYFLK